MRGIAALGPAGSYQTRTRTAVADASGTPAIEVSVLPELVIADWVTLLRQSAPLPPAEVVATLEKAADVFENEQILGDTLTAHEVGLARLSGTPLSAVREANSLIIQTLRDVQHQLRLAMPAGAFPLGRLPRDGRWQGAAWSRRGEVFAVHAAGNSPGVHAMWLEALALGYRVVVRPSSRDPLTPTRLILALRAAGLPANQVVLAPCGYAAATALIEMADLAQVYGGQDVTEAYHNRRDVRVQGPGRSKLIVAADADREVGVALAKTGAMYHAGTACTATTGILVESDPSGFARQLAGELSGVPAAPAWDEAARLPCLPVADARRLAAAVLDRVVPSAVHLAPQVEPVGPEGMAAITPAVVELSSPHDPLLSCELPFPCAWVAPFDRASVRAVDGSLVASVHAGGAELVEQVLSLPAVANVYHSLPTSWLHEDVPHDGFLADFLMRTKGTARGF